jgi:hypothetical protein
MPGPVQAPDFILEVQSNRGTEDVRIFTFRPGGLADEVYIFQTGSDMMVTAPALATCNRVNRVPP